MSLGMKLKRLRDKELYSLAMKKRWTNPAYCLKMKEMSKKNWKNPLYRLKIKTAKKDYKLSDTHKKKISAGVRRVWQNEEYKERVLKKTVNTLLNKPSSYERKLIDICSEEKLPYKYTGNGDVWIGGKNPDFININGAKIILEVYNRYHHPTDYEVKRSKHFAKYGYETIFINEEMIKNKNYKQIISEVIRYGNQ